MGHNAPGRIATVTSPCGDASIAEPGTHTAGVVGTMTRRNEMAKTFWLARDKRHDYYDGKVEEYSDIRVYQKKPKAQKDPWDFVDREGKTTKVIDIYFQSGNSNFDMCPDYFKAVTGLDVPYGKAVKVRLDLV